MSIPTLDIKGLSCKVEDKLILKGLNLSVKGGEIHVIMGPNGTGKSTLASVLMGHPKYKVVGGGAMLDGDDLFAMSVDERARAGLFLAMQYPAEIAGVTNSEFLRLAVNAHRPQDAGMGLLAFRQEMNKAVRSLEMREGLPDRYLNEGFSGGEKKRNEILQMLMLRPKIALLDEIDSGLDVDALRIVGRNVMELVESSGDQMGVLMITHYQRLLDYIKPDFVHIMMGGRLVYSGDASLALRVEDEGYDWLRKELGISVEAEHAFLSEEISDSTAVKPTAQSNASSQGFKDDLTLLF